MGRVKLSNEEKKLNRRRKRIEKELSELSEWVDNFQDDLVVFQARFKVVGRRRKGKMDLEEICRKEKKCAKCAGRGKRRDDGVREIREPKMQCNVCFEERYLLKTKCKHSACYDCWNNWLQGADVCMFCKQPLSFPEDFEKIDERKCRNIQFKDNVNEEVIVID